MPRRDTRPCEDCGDPTERVVRADRPWLCPACGAMRIAQNAIQLKAKKGPAYRRWKAAMQVTAHQLARGIDGPAR